MIFRFLLLSIALFSVSLSLAQDTETKVSEQVEPTPKKEKSSVFNKDDSFGKHPTYVKSDTLTLKAENRLFVYKGNVQVKQADMILTSDTMEGNYTEDNKIKDLTATKDVVITKGETIRANSEKAYYDAGTETLTLTENPELQQEGSVLTADKIIIYLEEDRSIAEGQVRVKLVKNEDKKGESQSFKIR